MPEVEVFCSLWGGHCEGCEVGSHRAGYVKCTGPDWATGKHTVFIDEEHPLSQREIEDLKRDLRLCDNLDFLKKVIKAQARLLVAYRTGGKPPEWVFDIIEEAKINGIEC